MLSPFLGDQCSGSRVVATPAIKIDEASRDKRTAHRGLRRLFFGWVQDGRLLALAVGLRDGRVEMSMSLVLSETALKFVS